MKLFILIDSNSIFHRAYHALPRFTTKRGELVNAAYGFSLILMKALKEFKPAYIAAAFDVPGPTFRDKEFEEYKAHREKAPDELYEQIPRIKQILSSFNVPIYEKSGFEADDIIGTVAKLVKNKNKNIKVVIVSGDLDTLQLVDKYTNVYTMKKSVQDTIIYDEKAVVGRYGLKPDQMQDFKGLRGDPSDNIPGVPGVGEKTATTLLKKYKNLEDLYKALETGKISEVSERIQGLLAEYKEQAFFSRMLATIRLDVKLKFSLADTKWGGFKPEKVEELFRELNFNRLIDRLSELEGFEDLSVNTAPIEAKESSKQREEELLQEIEETNDAGVFSDKIYKLEKDLVPVILSMEEEGIGIDSKVLKKLENKFRSDLAALEKKIYKEAGTFFNVNSSQQLSEVLFEKLKIDTKGIKKTPGKKISTAASELEKLQGKHPIIELIIQQRELQKLVSTYVTPLPKLADAQGRIHTTFKPLGTSTGRMSSKEPNLQNIPMRGDYAAEIRGAFVARQGNKFLSCDYSQMELRIVAHLAKDKNMISIFERDQDIHINTAAFVYGIDKEKVTKQMRYSAKALNFGLIYGMGPRAFAKSAQISYEEAQEFIQKYLDVFSGVDVYMKDTKEKAHQLGYVETLFGRKRLLPDLQSPNPMLRSFAERAAINMPVQGTAADIVKMAMIKTHKELGEINLLLQIHDELLWEGESDIIKKVAPKAKEILEKIVKLSVPLKVEYNIGNSWGELK